MSKILTEAEHSSSTRADITRFSNSYKVLFWLYKDNFSKEKEERYYAETKHAHKFVEQKWKEVHENEDVAFISIYLES